MLLHVPSETPQTEEARLALRQEAKIVKRRCPQSPKVVWVDCQIVALSGTLQFRSKLFRNPLTEARNHPQMGPPNTFKTCFRADPTVLWLLLNPEGPSTQILKYKVFTESHNNNARYRQPGPNCYQHILVSYS